MIVHPSSLIYSSWNEDFAGLVMQWFLPWVLTVTFSPFGLSQSRSPQRKVICTVFWPSFYTKQHQSALKKMRIIDALLHFLSCYFLFYIYLVSVVSKITEVLGFKFSVLSTRELQSSFITIKGHHWGGHYSRRYDFRRQWLKHKVSTKIKWAVSEANRELDVLLT